MTGQPSRRSGLRRGVVLAGLALVAASLLSACGGSDEPPLDPLAAEGRDIMRDSGCAACHGPNGAGGVGPGWIGRFGATAELEGGELVLVDTEYLTRAIADPDAEKVAGFTVAMPDNNLTASEIEAVVAYIEALGG